MLVAVIVVVVAIVVSSSGGGGSSNGLQKGKGATATQTQVVSLLKGIPQNGAYLGNPKAPVTLQYFGDLECPICQDFTLTTLPQLIDSQVRPGKLRVQYRALQTATHDPNVFKDQQIAALAAGKQNRLWNYIELFYHEQGQEDSGYVTESYLDGLAQQVNGLALPAWQSARNQSALSQSVSKDEQDAANFGFNSTPTLLFTGPGGKRALVGVPSYSQAIQAIQAVS